MKSKIKNIILNCLIVFGICFIILTLYGLYQTYDFYRVYTTEELKTFFNLRKTLMHDLQISLHWVLQQMIIFTPTIIILEYTKIKKNIYKIIIATSLTFIISIIYLIQNFNITF